jgi:carbon starvation protein
MLAEGFVAFIALVTVMIMTGDQLKGLKPGTIYGNGIGEFLTLIIGEENRNFAITFGAMAFSTFVFDTLDVSTRLGRYIVQELLSWRTRAGAAFATIATVAIPVWFIVYAKEGSWVRFWTLFGASNQLLAALTLLAISAWLHEARKRIAFTLVPMLFVLTITLWALGKIALQTLAQAKGFDISMANSVAAMLLIALALFLVGSAVAKLRRPAQAA